MKRIIALFVAVCIFAACRNEKKPDEVLSSKAADTLTYKIDSVKTVAKNQTKSATGPFDTAKAVIKFPVFERQSLNEYVKRKVFDFFDEKEKATSFKDITISFINGYHSFLAENRETSEIWQLLINLSVVAQRKNYIAIKYVHYDFVGGAHGNTNFSFLNYNPITDREIILDSLIVPSKKTALTNLAERIFRKNENLTPEASLSDGYFFADGKFSLPDRFYVGEQGLVFLYVPYEIKPYAAGTTTLVIPFRYLKDIAKPNTILTEN